MSTDKTDATTFGTESDKNIASALVNSGVQSTKLIVNAAQQVAAQYADLAPGKKPSYLGIFLVITSIALELVHAIVQKISFSETMLITMLISGIFILVAGSVLESLIFLVQMKSLGEEIKRGQIARSNVVSEFLFGKKDK
jgi:hypothetical protein